MSEIMNYLNFELSIKIDNTCIENYKNKSNNEIFEYINHILIDAKNDDMFSPFSFMVRSKFVKIFSWCLPSKDSIDQLTKFIDNDNVLEIAGGRGLWSLLLKNNNINIKCTSINDGHYYNNEDMKLTWTDIELLSYENAINKYSNYNCLFLSWGSGVLTDALTQFKGNKLILIGEEGDGCTDSMYEELENETGFKLNKVIKIPQWSYIHDKIFIYTR